MRNSAFTLIELLIAIAVIIVGALVPIFSATKQDARFAKAMQEIDTIRTACLMMH